MALINFQSIKEKKEQFFTFLEINKPDILVGTETWLTSDIYDSEYSPGPLPLPPPPELGYNVYSLDHIGQKGGGAIILVKSKFKTEYKTDCENLWVQLNIIDSKSVLIGAHYKPHELDQLSFEESNKSLNVVKQSNSTIWLLGYFNLPKINWEHQMPKPECSHPTFYSECLEAFSDGLLEQ